MRTDLLSHIVVGICDLHLDCSLTVLRVQELADLIAECFLSSNRAISWSRTI